LAVWAAVRGGGATEVARWGMVAVAVAVQWAVAATEAAGKWALAAPEVAARWAVAVTEAAGKWALAAPEVAVRWAVAVTEAAARWASSALQVAAYSAVAAAVGARWCCWRCRGNRSSSRMHACHSPSRSRCRLADSSCP
jgi:hypothetical protein